MSCATRAILQPKWSPTLQFVRYIRRINIQRPRAPHFERAKVLDVCKPYYVNPRKGMSLADLCEKLDETPSHKTDEENPYERFLAKEVLNWFNHSRMIAIFHGNPIPADDRFKMNIMFKKNNMYLKQYGKKIMRMAFEGTDYEAVLQLFVSSTFTAFSPEAPVSKLIKLNKKMPQLILMAAIVDGRLLSKNEIVSYSNMPDIETAQSGFVTVLNSAAIHLRQQLVQHQQTLVGHLDKHIELLKKSADE